MKKILAVVLVVGIIIGFIGGYGYFMPKNEQGQWRFVKSFIMTTENGMPNTFAVAYSYPDNHFTNEGDLQNFTVKEDFWRITLTTLPYYTYTTENVTSIVYYNGFPQNNIQIWKNNAFTDNPASSITLLDPTYQYNVQTGYNIVGDTNFYTNVLDPYVPVVTSQVLSGAGTYFVTLEISIGCFNFTIEEYR